MRFRRHVRFLRFLVQSATSRVTHACQPQPRAAPPLGLRTRRCSALARSQLRGARFCSLRIDQTLVDGRSDRRRRTRCVSEVGVCNAAVGGIVAALLQLYSAAKHASLSCAHARVQPWWPAAQAVASCSCVRRSCEHAAFLDAHSSRAACPPSCGARARAAPAAASSSQRRRMSRSCGDGCCCALPALVHCCARRCSSL
jgi:hypothetical protein